MSAATAHVPEISTGHDVVVGIDTHKLTHMAVALGANGGWLGSLKLDAKRSGYQELIRWAAAFGSNPVFAVVPDVNYVGGSRQLRRRVPPCHPPAMAGGWQGEIGSFLVRPFSGGQRVSDRRQT
ncbi:hypothetical protein [Synechococcus sp. CCY9202]|uniref:hypothetical protein n=1 Tax=Synechococcus sp. CCY9202 TaxID=174698 RepID=UPI002B20B868|nr:hypothetical protein [Synechococcus sp. CCY9202]MEA5422259.1 hypothetical protein [Synechococcus sp. CCY9202]